jgi:hypothetical protein
MRTRHLVAGVGLWFLAWATAAAASPTFAIPPYLQNVDTDSAVVGLRLGTACPVSIQYGPAGGTLSQQASSSDSGAHHFVTLEELTPGTPYRYTITACGVETGAGGTVRTAPGPGARAARFAVNGDFGTGTAPQKQVTDVKIQRMPEFWLTVGDNAYTSGTESEFVSKMFEPMSELLAHSPVFPVLGNHDYVTQNAQPYLDLFELPPGPGGTERYYAFDWGPVHIVALDSQCAAGHASTCTLEEQRAFLEQSFAATSKPWKVVVLHHPAYSSGSHGSTEKIRQLLPTMEAAGVDVVFAGHDHNYERSHPLKGGEVVPPGTPGAITHLVVGSGGAPLRSFPGSAPAWSAYRDNENHGFVEVEVNGGTFTSRFINTQNQVIDQFTLTKDVPEAAQPPTAPPQISVEPQDGQAPLTVTLIAEGPGAEDTLWNLGDGQFASGANVTHTYQSPGRYTATAQVGGAEGAAVSSADITVRDEQGDPGPVVDPPSSDDAVGGSGVTGCTATAGGALVPAVLLFFGAVRWRVRRRTSS